MATESGPFEDVSPIENGDFNCHVSSPGIWYHKMISHIWPIYSDPIAERIGHPKQLFSKGNPTEIGLYNSDLEKLFQFVGTTIPMKSSEPVVIKMAHIVNNGDI